MFNSWEITGVVDNPGWKIEQLFVSQVKVNITSNAIVRKMRNRKKYLQFD